ncbi:MAG TPA: serpin family protein [Saprospiraceae bacterium]|nr:serpin family protein [Saprospiraceae bacterium]
MKKILILGFVFCFFSACEKTESTSQYPDVDTSTLEAAISVFGWDIFKSTFEDQENALISPLSIHTALSMALMGADGNTFEKMKEAMGVKNLSREEIRDGHATLRGKLLSTHDATFLSTQNAVFYDPQRINIFSPYLNNLEKGFQHELEELNFNNPSAVDEINTWASYVTQDRIQKILESIDAEEIMFLINALYFLGDWELGFAPEITFNREFRNYDRTISQVSMMHSDDNRPFFINDDYSALDMDFKGNEYAMTFILPSNGDIQTFINRFKGVEWYAFYTDLISNKINNERVLTKLPRFEISTHYQLKDHLIQLGMTHTFDGSDFTLMGTSPLGRIFLSRVMHDAFIKVDEKGVEGAAVTTVGVAATSLPPTIQFDKPFLYVIRHKETGVPVFLGAVLKL